MTQTTTSTGRSLRIVATVRGDFDTAEKAVAAKKWHEAADVWTYHVVQIGDVYMLALIVDEQGREVKRLRRGDAIGPVKA